MQQRRDLRTWASADQSALDRRLAVEEARQVQDLASHPGFQLFHQACRELMGQAFSQLRHSKDHDELMRAQGECDAYEKVLKLPITLLGRDSERRRGSAPESATVSQPE